MMLILIPEASENPSKHHPNNGVTEIEQTADPSIEGGFYWGRIPPPLPPPPWVPCHKVGNQSAYSYVTDTGALDYFI